MMKEFMVDFFKRNFTRPHKDYEPPKYLLSFKPEEDDDASILLKDLKSGEYDIKKED